MPAQAVTTRTRVRLDAGVLPAVSLGALLGLSALLVLLAGHGLTFRHDDWGVVEYRYGGGASSFLEPLNEHLSLVPIALYRLLFALVGIGSYFWYRLALVAFDLLGGYLAWRLLIRRVPAAPALGLTALLVLCGTGYENLIFPIQVGQMGSIAGALGAWLALDRERPAVLAATLAVAFSLLCSAIGVPVLLGVGLEALLRRERATLAGLGVVAALFLAWYARYGGASQLGSLGHVPSFLAGIAAYTVTGVLELWPLYHLPSAGLILCGLAIALAAAWLLRAGTERRWWGPTAEISPPRLAGLALTAAVYWVLASLARADLTPYRSRYMYPGAVVLVLALAEFLRGRALPPRTQRALAAACAVLVALGLPYLLRNAGKYREESQVLSAQVGALERERASAPAGFQPSPERDPQVVAGALFRAERAIGSSPGSFPGPGAPAAARRAAEETLAQIRSAAARR